MRFTPRSHAEPPPANIVVLGVGNSLLQDDGVGVCVTETLQSMPGPAPALSYLDGGTLGLSLLPQIEDADAVIVVDASELGEAPGTLRIFVGDEADRHLGGNKRSVHEVAVSDLFGAARLGGRLPKRRALVAIQPASTEWGLEPTGPVRDAIPAACDAVCELARSWSNDT